MTRFSISLKCIARTFTRPLSATIGKPRNGLVRTTLVEVVIIGAILIWSVGNYIASRLKMWTPDPAPFVAIEIAATIAALIAALLILTTQRHADQLAEKRAQLTLQIAVLSEKKVAKVIELLEEQRRDNPMLTNRTDASAEDLSKAAGPAENLERIEQITPEIRLHPFRHHSRCRNTKTNVPNKIEESI